MRNTYENKITLKLISSTESPQCLAIPTITYIIYYACGPYFISSHSLYISRSTLHSNCGLMLRRRFVVFCEDFHINTFIEYNERCVCCCKGYMCVCVWSCHKNRRQSMICRICIRLIFEYEKDTHLPIEWAIYGSSICWRDYIYRSFIQQGRKKNIFISVHTMQATQFRSKRFTEIDSTISTGLFN